MPGNVLAVEVDPQYDGFDPVQDDDEEQWFDAEEGDEEDWEEDREEEPVEEPVGEPVEGPVEAPEALDPPPGEEEPVKVPRRDTGAYLHYSLAEPITDDHDVLLREAAVWLTRLASQHRIPNAAMDSFCQMVHFLLLPPENLFPRSFHMLKCALAAEDSHDCESHVCDECWQVFPDIPSDTHAAHAEDVCQRPGCCNQRFKRGPGGHVTPKRSAFFFGNKDTFVDLVSKPHMLPAMLRHREESFKDPESFWGSPAGKELNERCRHKFDQTSPDADEFAVLVSLGVLPP